MKEQIITTLHEVFKDTFNDQSISLSKETTANDIEGWDSITYLDLITSVEKKFNIEINGFDVMGLQNVGDLINLIEKKSKA